MNTQNTISKLFDCTNRIDGYQRFDFNKSFYKIVCICVKIQVVYMGNLNITKNPVDISYNKQVVDDANFNNKNISNSNVVDKDFDVNKQVAYDRLLTYRRRMARLSAVQTLYLYQMRSKMKNIISKDDLFHTDNDNQKNILTDDILSLCQDVIYFYKNIFFTPQEYGNDKKHRKIDETFMYEIVKMAIENVNIIDNFIAGKLNQNWTVSKLDNILLSIIRCAVAEIMLGNYVEKAVLSSEYTNIASDFFCGKEIGFINSITDKLYDVVIAKYPFSKNQI